MRKILNLEEAMLREAYLAIQKAYPDELTIKMTSQDLKKARKILLEDFLKKESEEIVAGQNSFTERR